MKKYHTPFVQASLVIAVCLAVIYLNAGDGLEQRIPLTTNEIDSPEPLSANELPANIEASITTTPTSHLAETVSVGEIDITEEQLADFEGYDYSSSPNSRNSYPPVEDANPESAAFEGIDLAGVGGAQAIRSNFYTPDEEMPLFEGLDTRPADPARLGGRNDDWSSDIVVDQLAEFEGYSPD